MYTRLPQGYRNVLRWLNRRDVCSEGMMDWVKENKFESLVDLWDSCQRSDWMLWLLDIVEYENDQGLRLFACVCVRAAVWDQLTDERSRNAVEVAERYAVGEATDEELTAARAAAWAATDAAVWAAAGTAAWAAARAAAWAAADAAAVWAAADAAAWAAANAANVANAAVRAAAWAAVGAAQASMLRDKIGNPFKIIL